MHGIDVETTALRPAEGDLRLVQLSDGKKAKVYDAFRQDAEEIRQAVEREDELQLYAVVLDLGLIACLAPLWRMLRYPSRPSERRRSRGGPTALTTAVAPGDA